MKIVGVAIKKDNNIYQLPEPNRHHNVIKMMVELGIEWPVTKNAIQGFITDDNTFLDRKEAMELVKLNGQNKTRLHGSRLYSEDLW